MDGWKTTYLFWKAYFQGLFAVRFREGNLFLGGVIVNPGYVDQGWRRARAGECTLMTAVMGGPMWNVLPGFFFA